MTKNAWRTCLGLALLLGACGGEAAREHARNGSDRPPVASGSELRRVEEIPVVATADERGPNTTARQTDLVAQRDAASADLDVRLTGPERVGPVHEDGLDAVGLSLEVENESDAAIAIHPAHARVEVYRDGRLLPGCDATVSLKLPQTLAPGVTHTAELSAPCPLPEDGDYEIVSTLVAGDEDPSVITPTSATASDSIRLQVDGALPPTGARSMPVADVPSRAVVGSEVPTSADPVE